MFRRLRQLVADGMPDGDQIDILVGMAQEVVGHADDLLDRFEAQGFIGLGIGLSGVTAGPDASWWARVANDLMGEIEVKINLPPKST